MLRQLAVVGTPLLSRFSLFVCLLSVLLCSSLFSQRAFAELESDVSNSTRLPAAVVRYAEIAPQSEEDVVELLSRVSEYAQSGKLFNDPIVIMLHGAEAKVFTQRNYSKYSSIVNLARRLDSEQIIDVQICEVWMSKNDMTGDELPDFIRPVPYGNDILDKLIQAGSVRF